MKISVKGKWKGVEIERMWGRNERKICAGLNFLLNKIECETARWEFDRSTLTDGCISGIVCQSHLHLCGLHIFVVTKKTLFIILDVSRGNCNIMIQPTRTRTIWMSIAILLVLAIGASALMARPATRRDPQTIDPVLSIDERQIMVVTNDSPFQPNSLCKSCHMELYEQWSDSMHALAWREPVFQAFYNDYYQYLNTEVVMPEPEVVEEEDEYSDLTGRELRRQRWAEDRAPEEEQEGYEVPIFRSEPIEGEISTQLHGDGLMAEGVMDGKVYMNCMKCHAPGADFTLDADLYLENNIDGVFCDYCHTIVDYTETEGYVIFWGHIKHGPRMHGTTSSHAIEYSRLMQNSRYCRGCHQYENPLGFAIYDTYDQWFNSEYNNPANTVHCQDCHMQTYDGRSSWKGDWRPDVASHAFGGGHNYEFMLETATVEFTTDVQGDELYIDVDVTNAMAGHNYPTSSGMRQLVLIVRLKGASDETLWEGKRIYERVLGDEDGNVTMAPWAAAQVLQDTTLLPGEIRTESFVVGMPATDDNLMVTAQLFYRATPEEAEIGTGYLQLPYRIDFATEFLQ